MNRIAVGILCGKGETAEALKVIQRVNSDSFVETVMPLFPAAPVKCKGNYIFYPPADANRRGAARQQIVRIMAQLKDVDYVVILDDDTLPDSGYFKALKKLDRSGVYKPILFTGKLRNADGTRSWDVCSFQQGRPVVVPYEFYEHPKFYGDLYFSGPQHIFNQRGLFLAREVGYPDLSYGEDAEFCRRFRSAGGILQFLPELSAQLLHQHNPPNEVFMWS